MNQQPEPMVNKNIDNLRSDYDFANLPYSLSNLATVKAANPDFTYGQIRHQLDGSEAFSRWRERKKRRGKRSVPYYVYAKRQLVQADVCYIGKTLSGELEEVVLLKNDGYKHMLVFIDVFTKYAWVYPLFATSQQAVAQVIRGKFLPECGELPKNLQTDNGVEFKGPALAHICRENRIHHYFASPAHKCNVVERFNRTLQRLLHQMCEVRGTLRWLDLLEPVLQIYRHRRHRTIKMTPFTGEQKASQQQLLAVHLERYAQVEPYYRGWRPKFQVGQIVRQIVRKKNAPLGQRGYHAQYSEEAFFIHAVHVNLHRPRYTLCNMLGLVNGKETFFEDEIVAYNPPERPPFKMAKVLAVRRGPQGEGVGEIYFKVKWRGYGNEFNTFISKTMFKRLLQYLSTEEKAKLF